MLAFLAVIDTLLLGALLVQRRRKEQPCTLQHAAALQRIERQVMSLKDDVQTLTDKVGNIEENTAKLGESTQLIADDVGALKQELIVANEKSNVDLTPLIQRASNISSAIGDVNTRLRDVAGPVAGSDPAAAPAPVDPGEGSETTG